MEKKTGLQLLREPFKDNQISKLPKPTKAQTEDVKKDYKKGTRCKECGGWHHPDVVHLDYVGHAALTDRLLDADPNWTWEPLAIDSEGLPRFDKTGGLWIKLTVCGQTRLGYGHAKSVDSKEIGSREKEVIGDALRNAAMRFGAALELWHKGDLHDEPEKDNVTPIKKIIDIKPPEMKDPAGFIFKGQHGMLGDPKEIKKSIDGKQPLNGQMYQNLILGAKNLEAGWQKVEAYTKSNFNKSPKLLNINEYEQVMKLITTGAL